MNRTDRLYGLVEELRAASPRPRSARRLAARFEVSMRTIERDLAALQQSGLPIWAEPGRAGGYVIDASATLGPAGFTLDEALAVLIGLGGLRRSPFRQPAQTAERKLLAVMPERDAARASAFASRVHFLESDESEGGAKGDESTARVPAPVDFAEALRADRVVQLRYQDAGGAESVRDVEPLGSIENGGQWYLIAWCRLRQGVRAFRADRMLAVRVTDERPPRRVLRAEDLAIPYGRLRSVVDD
ncbi:WYL domain-containing protein [Frigoribacterium sp. CFBP 8754]|uniref:helix-turn-helix transcriptional regulator n=1 Tax=unclassified Frigoribacterium TaxID=2627005 RepID=UPI0017810B8D|nr:WYL domain-containing protein [Frigoribacterium sp. CFBP 8754]MBD8729251.1 WYL domain-containing protein [Frigoribacterium sp. CFBP 13707]